MLLLRESQHHGRQHFKAIHDFYKKYAIPADRFARCALFAMSQPVNEILFRPTSQEL
jgi:hypothetical protein